MSERPETLWSVRNIASNIIVVAEVRAMLLRVLLCVQYHVITQSRVEFAPRSVSEFEFKSIDR